MLMIRLQRFGRKNDPSFRIVLTEKRNAPKSGKFLEILGFYNPKTKVKNVKGDRVKYWISKGAQLSSTAHNLFIDEKIIEGKKIRVVSSPKIKEETKTKETKSESIDNKSN